MAKAWILYAKRGDRWESNNREGADMIARQLDRMKTFFEKPGLEFGTEEDIPPYGDEGSSLIDMSIIMDNGTQMNLQVIVDRTVNEIEESNG